jgi:hypothetical protein
MPRAQDAQERRNVLRAGEVRAEAKRSRAVAPGTARTKFKVAPRLPSGAAANHLLYMAAIQPLPYKKKRAGRCSDRPFSF